MESVTYVTALYNLRKREGMDGVNTDHFSRVADYIETAKKLFDTPNPFVVFCEPDLEAPLRQMRGDRPTVFHVVDFEELPFWNLFPTIAQNNATNPVWNVSSQKFTDLYYLIINHKAEFVRQAAEENTFDTEWFAWVDMRSVLPDTGLNDLVQWWDPNRINVLMMNLCDRYRIRDKYTFFRNNHGVVAGGFMAGKRANVIEFTTDLIAEWKQALNDGYCPSDETMLTYMYSLDPSRVTAGSFGDYGDLIKNQAAVCGRQWMVYYIQEFGDLHTSIRAGEALRRGYLTGVLPQMADHEQFHIFYRLFLSYERSNQPYLATERRNELFRPEFDAMRLRFAPHL
jgi:hypothetical protein